MYSTCLFCHGSLGTNESVERFPVGRRLAFDEAKGRLWVVCRSCERWNLTPLEERWEAIEECERLFRTTPLRVSTDQIGLARVREGLELVRIGRPLLPEMAAWRYADQFGRRRRNAIVTGSALAAGGALTVAAVVTGASVIAAPAGVLVTGALLVKGVRYVFRRYPDVSMNRSVVPSPHGSLVVDRSAAFASRFVRRGDSWAMRLQYLSTTVGYQRSSSRIETFTDINGHQSNGQGFPVELAPADAVRVLAVVTAMLNRRGAPTREVSSAVDAIQHAGSPEKLCDVVADKALEPTNWAPSAGALTHLPSSLQLALEMATNEEVERAFLEGELHDLEQRWKDAEEVARIADNLFVARSVTDSLDQLKRGAPLADGNSTPPQGTN